MGILFDRRGAALREATGASALRSKRAVPWLSHSDFALGLPVDPEPIRPL